MAELVLEPSPWQRFAQAFSLKKNISAAFVRPNDNFAVVDGFRAFSMVWILVFHTFMGVYFIAGRDIVLSLVDRSPFYLNWIWNADKSVDVFFVVSGFLIAGILFREHAGSGTLKIKTFYARRFLRLSPVYIFAALVYYMANGPHAENLWANLLYIQNFMKVDEMAMHWTWTLAVEEQFYLLFPMFLLLVFFKSAHKIKWLIGLVVLSLLIRFLVLYLDPYLWAGSFKDIYGTEGLANYYFETMYDNLYTRFGSFACGILAAYFYYHRYDELKLFFEQRKAMVQGLSALSVFTILYFSFMPVFRRELDFSQEYMVFYVVFNRVLFGTALSWLILAALFPSGIGRVVNAIFSLKLWYPLAQLSYSMYLFHIMVVGFVLANFKLNLEAYGVMQTDIPLWWMSIAVAVILLLTVIISLCTFLLIEKPFMNMRSGTRPKLVHS